MTLTEARELVHACYDKADAHFKTRFKRAAIKFDLTGTTAGQHKTKNGKAFLRFNRKLMLENSDEFRNVVIPHEVAHSIQRQQDAERGVRSKPHGPEWKHIMIAVFKLSPKVTHKMDTSSVAKNTRPYLYKCLSCPKTYKIGVRSHSSLTRAPLSKRCTCGGRIEFVKKLTRQEAGLKPVSKFTKIQLD